MKQAPLILALLCGVCHAQILPPILQAPPATGGPSVVTACGNNASSAVASVVITCAVAAGKQIEVLGGFNSGSTVTVTDSAGDTFSTPAHTTSGSNSVFSSHTLSSPGGATTVTVTFGTANSFCTCMVMVMSGVTSVDVPESLGTITASGTSYAWNTITTTHTNDLVVAFGSSASVNNTYTAGGSYTIPTGVCATTGTCGQMSGGAQSAMIETFVAAATGSQSPTATGTTTLGLANLVLAFN